MMMPIARSACQAQIRAALRQKSPLVVRGGGTKDFYGEATAGDVLDATRLCGHRRLRSDRTRDHGARRHAGLPMSIETLARFGPDASVRAAGFRRRCDARRRGGGRTVGAAAAVRGRDARHRPRRADASTAAARTSRSAAAVMKNVAGFDLPRLMTGALGTLGPADRNLAQVRAVAQGRKRRACSNAASTMRSGSPTNGAASRCRSRRPAIARAASPCACPARCRRSPPPRDRSAEPRCPTATRSGAAFASRRDALLRCGARGRRAALAAVGQAKRPIRGSGRRADDRMERRVALARGRRAHRSGAGARVGCRPRRSRHALSRGRQERRRISSAAETLHALHRRLKAVFDPAGILNPRPAVPGL